MAELMKAKFAEVLMDKVKGALDDKNPSEMSDDEYSTWVAEKMMGGWIPLRQYLRMYPEETQAKIDTRVARKVWKRGVHIAVPKQSRAWVNLIKIREWIEDGGPWFD